MSFKDLRSETQWSRFWGYRVVSINET